MGRRVLVVAALALVCAGAAHPAPPPPLWTKTEQMVRARDGTLLATTLYIPATRIDPPVAGWPAVIMFHGLGGTRASMNALAEQTLAGDGFAVLTADHRGHGESGGLFDADGPQEIDDGAALFKWLVARGDIDAAHVGLFGVSLGGGVV